MTALERYYERRLVIFRSGADYHDYTEGHWIDDHSSHRGGRPGFLASGLRGAARAAGVRHLDSRPCTAHPSVCGSQ